MFRIVFLLPMISGIVLAEYHKLPENDPHSPHTLPKDLLELEIRLKCFVDEGPCNDVAQHYKEQLPTWVEETCGRCDPYLKLYIFVFIKEAKNYYPEGFEKLKQKYDPTGTAIERFVKEMKDKDN